MDNQRINDSMLRLYRMFDEHRDLYRQLKNLLDACAQGNGLQTVGGMFKYLRDNMKDHFRLEELLMGMDYPDATAHKTAHKSLEQAFANLSVEFEQSGSTQQILGKVALFTIELLIEHEQNHDAILEKYLVKKHLGNEMRS